MPGFFEIPSSARAGRDCICTSTYDSLIETVINAYLRLSRGTYELDVRPLDQIVLSMHNGANLRVLDRIRYVLPLKEP